MGLLSSSFISKRSIKPPLFFPLLLLSKIKAKHISGSFFYLLSSSFISFCQNKKKRVKKKRQGTYLLSIQSNTSRTSVFLPSLLTPFPQPYRSVSASFPFLFFGLSRTLEAITYCESIRSAAIRPPSFASHSQRRTIEPSLLLHLIDASALSSPGDGDSVTAGEWGKGEEGGVPDSFDLVPFRSNL